MTEDVSEYVKLGVELGVSAVTILGIVTLYTSMCELGNTISEREVLGNRIQEYRAFNQFNGTEVYPQDVVSVIYQYRGEPYVKVESSYGTMIWSTNTANSDFTVTQISDCVKQDVMYKATLERGANGEIMGISFVEK